MGDGEFGIPGLAGFSGFNALFLRFHISHMTNFLRSFVCSRISAVAGFASALAVSSSQAAPPSAVPGIVVNHSPASSGLYIGSPSIAILPNGDYVVSHDFFGPKSQEFERPRTLIFRSSDHGNSWTKLTEVQGAFWSSLFVHRGALYLLGPNRHHGHIYIRRSNDGGQTWTSPADSLTGIIRDEGEYHCAPTPVIEHEGRLWRAFEKRDPPLGWGSNYCAGMFSVPVDVDLLVATNWVSSNFVHSERGWNGGDMGGWLEGNAVIDPSGSILDILRVDTRKFPEKAAIVRISTDGKTTTFDPQRGFVAFSGGAKKFAIRFDSRNEMYWTLANEVPAKVAHSGRPASIRNTLGLLASQDLTNWMTRCLLLHYPETAKHGFQYPDWQFDGDDIIAAVRTAFDDTEGGAHNFHDANFLTFHRWKNFRSLSMSNSVPVGAAPGQ